MVVSGHDLLLLLLISGNNGWSQIIEIL